MSKTPHASYLCSECGWTSAKWVGRCGECQAWGSVAEAAAARVTRADAGPVTSAAVPIAQVSVDSAAFRSSGVPELDRVLGGGLVPGAAILLAGEPGVGKSTLLLEVAAQTARYQRRTLYVTGEESASQVRLRADRTGRRPRRALPRGRDRPRRDPHPRRAGASRGAGGRLRADDRRRQRRRRAGWGDPGEGGRSGPDPGGEDPRHHHDHGRPRHQGRLDRRPPRPRARRRRRAPLRGRPQLPLPDGPRAEEPLRPGRRGRLLRPRSPTASPR